MNNNQSKTDKNLLQCPFCRQKGVKNILGELDASGNFLVKRFAQSYTVIVSTEFNIKCNCGETIYFRQNQL